MHDEAIADLKTLSEVTMKSPDALHRLHADRFNDAVAMEDLVDQTKEEVEAGHIERMAKKACGGILFTDLCIDMSGCSTTRSTSRRRSEIPSTSKLLKACFETEHL